MPTWKVELIPEAREDFNSLDGSVKKIVLKQLIKLEQNPKYGDPLGNKAGINLEGYFKLYADKKRIRIIYEVIDDIIKIIAIDKREDMEVYRISRIQPFLSSCLQQTKWKRNLLIYKWTCLFFPFAPFASWRFNRSL